MKSLSKGSSPEKVDGAYRDVVMELDAEADDTPALGEQARQMEATRVDLAVQVEAHRGAQARSRVWTRRVKRRDKKVKRGAVELSRALHTYRDEAGVAELILRAFPVAATEGTAGQASEGQRLFVENAIALVKAAAGAPDKVKQRAAELEAAFGRLNEAVTARSGARQAEALAGVDLDGRVSKAVEAYNQAYFLVGNLVGKAKAEEIFGG